jgi:F-type H+-transporting ATPase subunit b
VRGEERLLEQLGINLPALVAQIVNFGLLLVILRMVAYQPILRMLDERSARIRESVEQAEEIKHQAARADEELAARRAEAMQHGQEIIARANEAAERVYRDAETRARQSSDEFLAKSRAEIDREREKAILDIRAEMADLAIFAASRLVGTSLDTKDHYRLVEEALAEAERSKLV